MQRLWVPGKLPGLNELIRAKAVSAGGKGGRRWNAYNALKKDVQERVAYSAFSQKVRHIQQGYFTYLLKEQTRQRDPGNVLSAAVKMIEDALIECKLLDNDGWDQVLGITGHPLLDKREPGVVLFVHPSKLLTREECILYELF